MCDADTVTYAMLFASAADIFRAFIGGECSVDVAVITAGTVLAETDWRFQSGGSLIAESLLVYEALVSYLTERDRDSEWIKADYAKLTGALLEERVNIKRLLSEKDTQSVAVGDYAAKVADFCEALSRSFREAAEASDRPKLLIGISLMPWKVAS